MASDIAQITIGELDGIPFVSAPTQGDFSGAITFRVGGCDETLPTSGITHLVEHLALPDMHVRGLELNGVVDGLSTALWATGDRDKVLNFLRTTCDSLRQLSAERLARERSILLTELERWAPGTIEYASTLRFGAVGHGLPGYDQFGIRHLTIDDAQAWSDRYFTLGNAVLQFLGEPPESLHLALGPGDRHPVPPLAPVSWIDYPCESDSGPDGLVTMTMLAARGPAIAIALRILNGRILDRLRFERGISYDAGAAWNPQNETVAHCVLWADAQNPGDVATARDLLEDIAAEFAEHGPTGAELSDARDLSGFFSAANPGEAVSATTHDLLVGAPVLTPRDWIARTDAVTPDEARQAFIDAYGSRLVVIPPGCRRGPLPRYPTSSPFGVTGEVRKSKGLRPRFGDQRLIAGSEGVTITAPPEERWSVRFSDCVGGLAWRDGTRVIFGSDGKWIEVSPIHWKDGDAVRALIDANVPEERLVPMDQEIAERAQQVEEAVDGRVRRSFLTKRELDLLPEVLEAGEEIQAVARADRGRRNGVLAVTSWRLLFLAEGDVLLETQLADVTEVSSRGASKVLGIDGKLRITARGTTHSFSIGSNARLQELVEVLRSSAT